MSRIPGDTFEALMQELPWIMSMAWVLAHDGDPGREDEEWAKDAKAKIWAFIKERGASIRGNRPGTHKITLEDCRLLMSSVLEECQRMLDEAMQTCE